MPDMTSLVQPVNPGAAPAQPAPPDSVAPANTVTPPPAPDDTQAPAAPSLPHELIKMPVMQALIAGSPPAVSDDIREKNTRAEADVFREHKALLQRAGFGFYRSLSGKLGVIYNSLHIHPEDILAADKAGKLPLIAPPFDVVNHAVSKSGATNPVLSRSAVPGGPALPSPKAPPGVSATMAPGASGPSPAMLRPAGLPAGAQRSLAKARLAQMAPGSPTSGPEPGAGRLLNQILKPVV